MPEILTVKLCYLEIWTVLPKIEFLDKKFVFAAV